MMRSSCSMKPTRYWYTAWPAKNSVIDSPIRILARCCLTSGLVEELHLDAGDLDQIVVLERVRRRTDGLAVHGRTLRALDVGDEVALRAARQHGDLHAGLAERGERFRELELLAGIPARWQLDGAKRLRGLWHRSRRHRRSHGSRCGRRGGRGNRRLLADDGHLCSLAHRRARS